MFLMFVVLSWPGSQKKLVLKILILIHFNYVCLYGCVHMRTDTDEGQSSPEMELQEIVGCQCGCWE